MQDHLPDITPYWHQLENHLRILTKNYAYQEIHFPVLEKTALFTHSIGAITDIIEKEMYTFQDSKQQLLSLRPEGTAGCIRAVIEHKLFEKNQMHRLWYLESMFRRERPQQGRYRQFYQFGVEALGMKNPQIDAELILMSYRLWNQLNLKNQLHLEINSLGNTDTRERYKKALIEYFEKNISQLDLDSKRRLTTNPLRILDSKNPDMSFLIKEAPCLLNYLDEESSKDFSVLQQFLKESGVPFTINSRLVRGLDYYNKTVFEWSLVNSHSSQNTVCGGGRYDVLIERLGGPPKPAAGFAIGLERLITLWMHSQNLQLSSEKPYIYLIQQGPLAEHKGLKMVESIRNTFPNLSIEADYLGGSFKNQFKRADQRGAVVALVLGEDEMRVNAVTVKWLRQNRAQSLIPIHELTEYFNEIL